MCKLKQWKGIIYLYFIWDFMEISISNTIESFVSCRKAISSIWIVFELNQEQKCRYNG